MRWAGIAAAAGSLLLLAVQLANHVRFPAPLEMLEGTVLQHVARAAAGQPVYTDPSREFIAFAYNPGFYYASIPMTWIFGVTFTALRVQAILALIGCAALIGHAVRERTNSIWWGLMATGLFAAAYDAMDAYLDGAHSDSSLLFCALLGSWLISRGWTLGGMAVLVAAFWFKQQGVWFVFGGFAFTRSLPALGLAIAGGPLAYWFAGPPIAGPRFHFYTWEVPRAWLEPGSGSFLELCKVLGLNYVGPIAGTLWHLSRTLRSLTIWHYQLIASAVVALMGAMDSGSSNNVYAPFGAFLILHGVTGLWMLSRSDGTLARAAVLCCFLALANNPRDLMLPAEAGPNYQEFLAYSKSLGGTVWAPKFGQLPERPFAIGAHWVAVYDLIRGRGRDERAHPFTKQLLTPQPDFIVMHNELEPDPVLGFLAAEYTLHSDLGDRFRALGNVPHRFGIVWPRLVYKRVSPATEPR